MVTIKNEETRRIAGIEVNALAAAGVFPVEAVADAEVSATATEIYDINGEVLFHRIPLERGRVQVGVVDIAVHEVIGDPFMGLSAGLEWRPDAIVGEAREHAKRQRIAVDKADEVRFVAYSYPKIAVQFLAGGEELAMIEWLTWQAVPPAEKTSRDRKPLEPTSFERWSIVDETSAARRRTRARNFGERHESLRRFTFDLNPVLIRPHEWLKDIVFKLVDTREINYSLRAGDHTLCYELRGQQTNVWCVGASAQMLLDFYRYEYTQVRLAQQLGLGTLASPNGLPYSQVGNVVTALEALTGNGLDVTMVTNPGFATFRDEIRQNRPLISFVPGHSRTVAGYTETLIAPIHQQPFRGLLVFDPWPPNAGVITRWENFATQTYQFAYSARVTKI